MSLAWPTWTLSLLPALLAGQGLRLAAAPPPDSALVVRRARHAQADFEQTRRASLPLSPGHFGSSCDERIGRFCYWYDEAGASPSEEPRRIGDAREQLLAVLDGAAVAVPGDPWIAGQRVRYLVEAGGFAAALAAARSCRAVPWWCEVLAGFALHGAGDFGGADSAYDAAARDMPSDERCRWTDVSLLLERDLRRHYERLACDERAAFEARLWWLAQPLYSRPGSDRRTEHWARLTLTRLLEHATTPYDLPWGDDLRELTIRYGWPVSWAREARRAGEARVPSVIGHEAQPAWRFLPVARTFSAPESSGAVDWTAGGRRPRERYAPPYAASLTTLESQVAVFRRGDSSIVVASYDLSRNPPFMLASPDAALVLARDETTAPVVVRRHGSGPAGVLVATAAWRPRLVSVEVTVPAHRRIARARRGVLPWPDRGPGASISDLLLFDPPDPLPAGRAEVLPLMRGSSRVRSDSRLGLFWEIYGLAPQGETMTTTVTVAPVGEGWLRRLTAGVGLAGRRTPLRLEWQEELLPHDGAAERVLALELAHLSPGRYRLTVAIATAGEEPAVATREIEVVAR